MNLSVPLAATLLCTALASSTPAQVCDQFLVLEAEDGTAVDQFGAAVAVDGGLVAVGAPTAGQTGSVTVFDAATGAQLVRVTPPAASGASKFGSTLDLDGNLMVVGAPDSTVSFVGNAGSAYVVDVTTGSLVTELHPSVATPKEHFGTAVAIEGTIALVSSHSSATGTFGVGSLYAFDAITGVELYKLSPSGADYLGAFGKAIAVDQGRILVRGNGGLGLLYELSTGAQIGQLVPEYAGPQGFGPIALGGGTALVARSGPQSTNAETLVFDVASGIQRMHLTPEDSISTITSVTADGGLAATTQASGSYVYDLASGAQVGKLIADGPVSYSLGGSSIAIGGDLVAVGRTTNGSGGAGYVVVFDLSDCNLAPLPDPAQVCTEARKFVDSASLVFEDFGRSVGVDGSLGVIGSKSRGARIVDLVSGSELFELDAGVGTLGAGFGHAVAIDGGLAIVGAPIASGVLPNAGQAFMFDAVSGSLVLELLADDPETGDRFGLAVAISGQRAVVGAPDDLVGAGSGSTYLYDVGQSAALAKLAPATAQWPDEFGRSVAISDSSVAVGSLGAVHLFRASDGLFLRTIAWPSQLDSFGQALALSGDTLVVGLEGAAITFDVPSGALLAVLEPSDGVASDQFGVAVGIHGNLAIVGARGDYDQGYDSGSAYLFDPYTGAELAKLLASSGGAGDLFGSAVDIDGSHVIVGAIRVGNVGAGYSFDVPVGAWAGLGGGQFGTKGLPVLTGCGLTAQNAALTLTLTGGRPASPALVVLGGSQVSLPFLGGVLVPFPDVVVTTLSTEVDGSLQVDLTIAPALPGGAQIFSQVWIPDALAPLGAAASNGLMVTAP
ncbi:PQQ-binding-like beta-propeller repeat protein [Engelhardtia mirabilis]|uniref:Uncharacterized protein n=1 Tax=Engelhardtia mirabilis TaxID=2528011 RepID=A0A518BFT0_9BACT|nr:hypothetical protein Pla133_08940 [Planctomycetes bacterium Pla133]QDV00154.1 hypothetical protein Pla86_08930 [Planctomycetes bacterium Pla86]